MCILAKNQINQNTNKDEKDNNTPPHSSPLWRPVPDHGIPISWGYAGYNRWKYGLRQLFSMEPGSSSV